MKNEVTKRIIYASPKIVTEEEEGGSGGRRNNEKNAPM